MSESRAPGLRLQILLALAGLMALAFVPLYFAVASLTRASLEGAERAAAAALGHAIGRRLAAADALAGPSAAAQALHEEIGHEGVVAARLFDGDGGLRAEAGDARELAGMAPPRGPLGEPREARAEGALGPALDVVTPSDGRLAVVRVRLERQSGRAAPLVRLVALYMTTFALALLTFAYFALTRIVVRPVESLVRSADRVASGSRALAVPRAGARELVELGASVNAMATKLIADEAAMRAKVDELTRTTKRLTEAQEQLVRSERMASVGRLAAGVAHEIGNPIAAILGMEDLLLEGGLSEDEQNDFMHRMKKETERIHVVVRDLLDFARPEKAAGAESSGSFAVSADVRAVVDDVRGLVRPQKALRDVAFRIEVEGEPRVRLAAPRLTQVLLNLVLNAASAIESTKKPGTITVRARADGSDTVRIEVEDDGPGVAPEVRDRIFEPFVTTKDVGEGTGLGLAVCRGLIESAGGRIELDAAHGPGARFMIVLPAGA